MRFSILQILMLVALAALLVVFWQSEPQGQRESRVESIKFSPDGSKLAVMISAVRRTGPLGMRTALSPGEYVDPTRDIFTIETARGGMQRSPLRESINGDSPRRPRLPFLVRGTPMAFNPGTQEVAVVSIVDNQSVFLDVEGSLSKKLEPGHPVEVLAFSKTGKWLACLGDSEVLTVFDTATLKQVQQVRLSGKFFGLAGSIFFAQNYFEGVKLEFSEDETKVLVKLTSEIWEWDFMSSAQLTRIGPFDVVSGLPISHFEIAPDGELIHCATIGIVVTDGDGLLQKKLVGLDQAFGFSFSNDCRRFVFLQHGLVNAYQIGNDFEKVELPDIPAQRAIISPDGKRFAVTKGERKVALFDFETAEQVWQVRLPERSYITWPWPAAGIAIWSLIAIEMWLRTRRSANRKAGLEA